MGRSSKPYSLLIITFSNLHKIKPNFWQPLAYTEFFLRGTSPQSSYHARRFLSCNKNNPFQKYSTECNKSSIKTTSAVLDTDWIKHFTSNAQPSCDCLSNMKIRHTLKFQNEYIFLPPKVWIWIICLKPPWYSPIPNVLTCRPISTIFLEVFQRKSGYFRAGLSKRSGYLKKINSDRVLRQ